jgi:hypothetical protein
MNRRQRMKNRATAAQLKAQTTVCPECGEKGAHWLYWFDNGPDSDLFDGTAGFWTCAKFYGPDGRRIE